MLQFCYYKLQHWYLFLYFTDYFVLICIYIYILFDSMLNPLKSFSFRLEEERSFWLSNAISFLFIHYSLFIFFPDCKTKRSLCTNCVSCHVMQERSSQQSIHKCFLGDWLLFVEWCFLVIAIFNFIVLHIVLYFVYVCVCAHLSTMLCHCHELKFIIYCESGTWFFLSWDSN